jgi:hypothetical protein
LPLSAKIRIKNASTWSTVIAKRFSYESIHLLMMESQTRPMQPPGENIKKQPVHASMFKFVDRWLSLCIDCPPCLFYIAYNRTIVGRDSTVGIATRYGLDGPGIESCWIEIFRTRPDWPLGATSLLYNDSGSFPLVNQPGRGVEHLPHLAPRLKKEYSDTSTPLPGLRGLL